MGHGGTNRASVGQPWLGGAYYVPGVDPFRDGSGGNAADPPRDVVRSVAAGGQRPATTAQDQSVLAAGDYKDMRERLESIHNSMHGYVNMGSAHVSFRDPFVYLLHSNVDRLFAQWQVNSAHPERLNPTTVYGSESNQDVRVGGHIQNVNHNIEPWASGHTSFGSIASWNTTPEVKNSKDSSVVTPPIYDTFLPATYQLSRAGDALINWSALDGGTYQLDISQSTSGQWLMTNDSNGRPVMAFRRNTGQDAELVLSLEGAPSISSLLLHNEDDFPRKYYYASDGGNNNPLGRPAFILRAEGLSNSPVLGWGSFKVLCV